MSDENNKQDNNGNGDQDGDVKPPISPRKRRIVLMVIASVFVLAGLAWLLMYIFVFSKRVITEDAYVQGNQVVVSSQIPGTVVSVSGDNTDRVESGQTIVSLDRTDAEVGLANARSALAAAVRSVRQMRAQAEQSDAAIDARKVALRMARANLARRQPLLAEKAVAQETLDNLRDKVSAARADLKLAERQAAAAHAAVDGVSIEDNPQVLRARAQFRKAWLTAHRTAIVAPVSGYIANSSVQVGQQVKPGVPLMQIISLDDLWIDANFKESDLQHVRIGQPVTVKTDLYGDDVTYHGKVIGLSAGTGAAFALLPPQNASGNWIKVVQRVPVRVSLQPDELRKHPLRIGLSTEVTIDTHNLDGRVLAQKPTNKATSATSVYSVSPADAERAADAIIQANLDLGSED